MKTLTLLLFSLFSLPLSRDSYIRLSHPLVSVKHFFKTFFVFLKIFLNKGKMNAAQSCGVF